MNLLRSFRSVLRFKKFEWNATTRRLGSAASISDLRRIAQKRLPAGIFDYIDGGAEDELTLGRNSADFARITFRPRVLADVAALELGTELFGRPMTMPLILSPTGFTRIADPEGELSVARSAQRAGIPYTLSTMATRSIEEVRAVSSPDARNWFQVYVWRDRDLVARLLERAKIQQYEAIVITVDTPVLGRRERDIRRGFLLPPKVGLDTLWEGARHPRWTLDLLRAEPITFANLSGSNVGDGSSPVALAQQVNSQFDASLSWRDIEWFRDRWAGPIVLKGIQRIEDARIAVDSGIDAIALSNHGGRQLDGAPSPVSLIAEIVEGIDGAIPVLCDGGIRRGSDIAKALSLGAKACMIGRAYLYGLASGGELGVDHSIELLREGLAKTMALTGTRTVDNFSRDLVVIPRSWQS
ncbi:MAG TPA: alpha-hydroxy acid oxidase [Acidimicrobiales bacterium]|nr:alpha-hydroxy acid oxidase [Acidimicrobiales bacterium]